MIFLDLIILCILSIISWQDFKYRAISWFLIPVLAALCILQAFLSLDYKTIFINSAINIGFLSIQFFILTIYFSIKQKKLTNIINTSIGVGDVLFLTVLCFYFSPINFVLFTIASLFIITLTFGIVQLITNSRNMQIPLAGALSTILFIMIIGKNIVYPFNLFDDYQLTQFIQLLYV